MNQNNQNGKGDSPRSCFSKEFKNNYDEINWDDRDVSIKIKTNKELGIIEAPNWLKQRMEDVKNLPPASLEEMQESYDNSIKLRKENEKSSPN